MTYTKTQHIFLALLAVALVASLLFRTQAQASSTGTINATMTLAICGDGIKDHGEQCDGSDIGSRSCSYLGFDSGTLGCTPSCQFDVTSCVTSATASSNMSISPVSSGTYVLSDGDDSLGLTLPSGFHQSDLSLFLFSYPDSATAPTGETLVGKLFKTVFVNDNGDLVSTLDKVATATLTYAPGDLGGNDESTLAPYQSNDAGATWGALPDYTLDTTGKTVTVPSDQFSLFSIFGAPPATGSDGTGTTGTTTTGGGGGGGGISIPPLTPAEIQAMRVAADFNHDGVVNLSDLSIMLYYYGQTGSAIERYDLNHDGTLDISDISIVMYYWQVTT